MDAKIDYIDAAIEFMEEYENDSIPRLNRLELTKEIFGKLEPLAPLARQQYIALLGAFRTVVDWMQKLQFADDTAERGECPCCGFLLCHAGDCRLGNDIALLTHVCAQYVETESLK